MTDAGEPESQDRVEASMPELEPCYSPLAKGRLRFKKSCL